MFKFKCNMPGCGKKFDTVKGRNLHMTKTHKTGGLEPTLKQQLKAIMDKLEQELAIASETVEAKELILEHLQDAILEL